jgi:hypothetical protein
MRPVDARLTLCFWHSQSVVREFLQIAGHGLFQNKQVKRVCAITDAARLRLRRLGMLFGPHFHTLTAQLCLWLEFPWPEEDIEA